MRPHVNMRIGMTRVHLHALGIQYARVRGVSDVQDDFGDFRMMKSIIRDTGVQSMMLRPVLINGAYRVSLGSPDAKAISKIPIKIESPNHDRVDGGPGLIGSLLKKSLVRNHTELGTKHAAMAHIVAEKEPTKRSGIAMKIRGIISIIIRAARSVF